jgi:chromosome segregation ATPase
VDVYFKVEGNKEKTASTVYLMTSLGNDNFFTNENHPQEIQNMMTFLDGLVKEVTVAKALADLKPVEASVVAAEKKVDNLKKEGEKLVAEKKNTETKIADNVTEQGRLQTELDNQERLLEIAKSQTGTVEQMTAIKKDISKQEDAFEKIKKKLATAVKDADKMKYNVSKLEEKIKQNENETAKAMDDAAVQRQTLKDMREQYDMLKR